VQALAQDIGLELDISYLLPELPLEELKGWQREVDRAHVLLMERNGPGADFLGWMDPRALAPEPLFRDIEETAASLRENSDALVVIGIGGSYLGARAVIEALGGPDAKPVYFAGTNISAAYHLDLLRRLEGRRVAVNVISKSGTTTEPAIALRVFRQWLAEQGGDAASRVVATTDANRGSLLNLARQEGWKRFVVPDDVGGRFSVLSPVGLLPIAYAGIDIRGLVRGAARVADAVSDTSLERNPVFSYAAARNALYEKGYCIEMLAHFEPRLRFVAEWWKQLFGESEGKDGKGLFPASLDLTADLHSMGQYAQQGRRMLIETFLVIREGEPELRVPAEADDGDGMNYLAGRTLEEINREAYRATALAHREGGVPVMSVLLERLDAERLGALLYFFERACAVSGYLLRVNPFNQPGVEAYKRHMFALLGKPGFEEQTNALRQRLEGAAAGGTIRFSP
jgi:glucose-6-phosphate isomerase